MRKSVQYWRERYNSGGNSGSGSYGTRADFKAQVLNKFIIEHGIKSILDLGCGDGNQASLLKGFESYLGVDVSKVALKMCRERFGGVGTMSFMKLSQLDDSSLYDLVISLDVVYHLLEDDAFEEYMSKLFRHADKYVIIYSSDRGKPLPGQGAHMRQHKFTKWVKANEVGWVLLERIRNEYPYSKYGAAGSISDFYIYGRK
jgi:SAM-dependent methyltransferase